MAAELTRPLRLAAVCTTLLALAACQSERTGGPLKLQVAANGPVTALQTINEAAAKCWHRSGDPQFSNLRTIPELDTTAGRPRLLVVNAKRAQGLPQLVIEASGDPVTVTTYGPLANTAAGARINKDVMRWSSGAATCKA